MWEIWVQPGLGRSPGEGKGYPLQYSGPENSMNCIVHGVTKSWTRLSDFDFHFLYLWASPVAQMVKNLPAMQKTWVQSLGQKDPLEKGMATCREPAYCILSAALSTASSFRIWNSSTGILSLPGASVRNFTHDKGHEEGGSAYTKVGSSLRSPPGNSQASTPQTWVCLLSALCFHLHLWLYGGCPPPPLSEKRVSLQLQLIIPGCDSVSTYKLLWKSSSLPE